MLKFGDMSIEVVELHEWLRSLGLYSSYETFYGVDTIEAVKALQRMLGLNPNGLYDEQIRIIYELSNVASLSATLAAPEGGGSIPLINVSTPSGGVTGTVAGGAVTKNNVTNEDGTENEQNQAKFDDSYLLNNQEFPCYLVNLLTNNSNKDGVVFFPHIPDEFTYTKGNVYEEQLTMGRSEPFLGYSNSTSLTTDISLTISADYAPNHDIDAVLTKLEAFTYPRYGVSVRPPKCFFRCGTFCLEGVLTELSITRKLPIIDGKYSQAEVTFSLTETNATSISAKTVQDSSYRGYR